MIINPVLDLGQHKKIENFNEVSVITKTNKLTRYM